MDKITIQSEISRQWPDPLNKITVGEPVHIEHHMFTMRALDLPEGFSMAPNPREQNTNKRVYRDVRDSLDDVDNPTFHLKNQGITILASKVEYSPHKETATISFGDGHGISNGAHTYSIIQASREAGTCPPDQYIKLEVLTGVPQYLAPDITGGLNTAVQVDDASLMNLEGRFEWVKDALSHTPYGDKISYKQNEDGVFHITQILALMHLFNVNKNVYPSHPKEAYTSKSQCLKVYDSDEASFQMLKPILPEILELHDYVHINSREAYNKQTKGSAGAMTGVYFHKKKGVHNFIFINAQNEYKLYDGALYPMLGSLRFLIEQKPGDDVYSWKLGSFKEVLAFFDSVAPDLVDTTYKTSLVYGRKPNAIGKDDNHWDNMYKTVALKFLMNGT
jgi:hypothetical protein